MNEVIELKEVCKYYRLYDRKADRLTELLDPMKRPRHHKFQALKNISLTVEKGEVLGIVGRNGSGKSTLLKLISGIMPPSSGELRVSGMVVPLIELGAGFNPEFTGLENIYFYNGIHGFSQEQTDAMLDQILDFSEIGAFIDQPLKTYSSGMIARLAFAVSININPDILILDEVLSVGDEMFRRKCFARMEAFFKGDKTVLYVSHAVNSIHELCTRCVWLNEGELILDGPPKLVTAMYTRMGNTSPEHIPRLLEEIRALNQDTQMKAELYHEINSRKKRDDRTIDNRPELSDEPDGNSLSDMMEMMKTRAQFIPDMMPKSTLYECHHELEIRDIQLETLYGERVNVILSGEEFQCRYTVSFRESLQNVYFRIIFTSETGVILGAMNTRKTGLILSNAEPEDAYSILWHFRCNLLTGHYFVSVSVHGISETEVLTLARVSDALAFQVIEPREIKQGGVVLMDLRATITKQ